MDYIKIILNVLCINQLIPFLVIIFVAISTATLIFVLINEKNDTYISKISISLFKINIEFSERTKSYHVKVDKTKNTKSKNKSKK